MSFAPRPLAPRSFAPRPPAPGRPIACVGIDPSAAALAAWGLPDDADGALRFGRRIVEAANGAANGTANGAGAVVKPQVAYFERFGSAGYAALETLIAEAREAGVPVIADAKRADIGPTIAAYADAWLGEGAPMRADAVTAVPYLGLGSLTPLLDRAHEAGAYVFVVVRSSNPEGAGLQNHGEPPVWVRLMREIEGLAARYRPGFPGAVVGAINPDELREAVRLLPDALLLVPGIGAQGGRMEDIAALPPEARERLVLNASRSVAACGPQVGPLREAIAALTELPDV